MTEQVGKVTLDYSFYNGQDQYSDGDIEDDLLKLITEEPDVEKILKRDDRWPVLYHFSPVRQNILEWYPFKKDASVLEIGSGGGFPSIPLKIVRDDLKFTLCDSTGKKCEYLKEAVKYLKLDNLEVVCARAEDLGKNPVYREKFDIVTARAVARMNTLSEYCLPLVKVGGKFIALKGEAKEELEEAAGAIDILGGKVAVTDRKELPFGYGERNVIVIEKVKNTPSCYPRGNGKERKKPL